MAKAKSKKRKQLEANMKQAMVRDQARSKLIHTAREQMRAMPIAALRTLAKNAGEEIVNHDEKGKPVKRSWLDYHGKEMLARYGVNGHHLAIAYERLRFAGLSKKEQAAELAAAAEAKHSQEIQGFKDQIEVRDRQIANLKEQIDERSARVRALSEQTDILAGKLADVKGELGRVYRIVDQFTSISITPLNTEPRALRELRKS